MGEHKLPREAPKPTDARGITPINLPTLCHMNTFTDDEGGVIIMFTPILPDGNLDPIRTPYFRGQVAINGIAMTFNIVGAKRLEDCYGLWATCVKGLFEELKSAAIKQQLLAGIPGAKPQ